PGICLREAARSVRARLSRLRTQAAPVALVHQLPHPASSHLPVVEGRTYRHEQPAGPVPLPQRPQIGVRADANVYLPAAMAPPPLLPRRHLTPSRVAPRCHPVTTVAVTGVTALCGRPRGSDRSPRHCER